MTRRRYKPTKPTVFFAVRKFRLDLRFRLEAVAKAKGVSIVEMLNEVIEVGLGELEPTIYSTTQMTKGEQV